MNIDALTEFFFVFAIASARMQTMFMLLPFLARQSLGTSMIRNGVVASFSLISYPLVNAGLEAAGFDTLQILILLIKEVLIGFVLGYVFAIPFWAVESAGFFIDNQRGSTMASAVNPMSGSQTSPLGILLNQALVTVFFSSGAFLLLLYAIYNTFVIWPVFEFMPTLITTDAKFFIGQLDTLMRLTMLLAAPVVIVMFLTEFGLALISRFAPQLNVFILAMPLKSGVGIAFLILYGSFMIRFFLNQLNDPDSLFNPVIRLIG